MIQLGKSTRVNGEMEDPQRNRSPECMIISFSRHWQIRADENENHNGIRKAVSFIFHRVNERKIFMSTETFKIN